MYCDELTNLGCLYQFKKSGKYDIKKRTFKSQSFLKEYKTKIKTKFYHYFS